MTKHIGTLTVSVEAALTEDSVVVTPEGTGTVMAVHDQSAVALVVTADSTRPWAFRDLSWIDGSPVCATGDGERAVEQRARLAAAQTEAGAALRDGCWLAKLDLAAGHGQVQDASGAEIAYVRARLGEDGRRYWWLQRADGGAPFDTPTPEHTRPDQPHAALRAAGWAFWYLRSGDTGQEPVAAARARRTVTLTLARVRELRSLPLPVSPVTGDTVSAPEWNERWRRYELDVSQMSGLASAARVALSTLSLDTVEHRRRRRVLLSAAESLEFLAYDTARAHATIAPPGEHDAYSHPYEPHTPEPAVPDLDTCADEAETHDLAAVFAEPEFQRARPHRARSPLRWGRGRHPVLAALLPGLDCACCRSMRSRHAEAAHDDVGVARDKRE